MSETLRVLVIDDHEPLRETLREEIEQSERSDTAGLRWEVLTRGFGDEAATLNRFRPDMVVLDLVDGEISGETAAGNSSYEQIRDIWFCPIVVYTGYESRRDFGEHPFVAQVKKGLNTEANVLSQLRGFVSIALVIRSVHQEFDRRIRSALDESVQSFRDQIDPTNGEFERAILQRAVRRLVAAQVDAGEIVGDGLKAWERFIVPPLGDHLLTADLLRLADAEWSDEDAFRLVLTPSCDLVRHGRRSPKANEILVARCEPPHDLGGRVKTGPGLNKRDLNRRRIILRDAFREGIAGPYIPIPQFHGHVPLMLANLRRLELIPWDRIQRDVGRQDGEDGLVYRRIASTDSPFRELVVWANLRVTGRPGIPEIDVDEWIDQITRRLDDCCQS